MELSKPNTININVNSVEKENYNQGVIGNCFPWPFPFPMPFPFPWPSSDVPIFLKGQASGNGTVSTLRKDEAFELSMQLQKLTGSKITKSTSLKEMNAILKPVYAKIPHLKGQLEEVYEEGNGDDGGTQIMGLFFAGFVAGVIIGAAVSTVYHYVTKD